MLLVLGSLSDQPQATPGESTSKRKDGLRWIFAAPQRQRRDFGLEESAVIRRSASTCATHVLAVVLAAIGWASSVCTEDIGFRSSLLRLRRRRRPRASKGRQPAWTKGADEPTTKNESRGAAGGERKQREKGNRINRDEIKGKSNKSKSRRSRKSNKSMPNQTKIEQTKAKSNNRSHDREKRQQQEAASSTTHEQEQRGQQQPPRRCRPPRARRRARLLVPSCPRWAAPDNLLRVAESFIRRRHERLRRKHKLREGSTDATSLGMDHGERRRGERKKAEI
nr:unnamed protein product [Digitaria exilis]